MFGKSNLAQVISIFLSYADEDIEFSHGLDRQLSSLKREGLIQCYNRHAIAPGIEWRAQAKEALNTADIILLLVSPFFVASDYCYQEEATLAMALHNSGKTRVIPVIVRPIEWERLIFGELASLPTGEAVSMWPNTEEAFSNIVKGIKETIDDLRSKLWTSSKDSPLSFWNIPYWQNPFFTGREDILANLERTFTSTQTPLQAQALSGLAGVGKTQIGVEYAYRHTSSYQAVLWVHADSPEILLSSFVYLADVLDLPERHEANQPSIVRAVKRWLQQHSRWLLIVDNLEEIDLLRDMVPSPHSGHILVTTRSHHTGHLAHRIALEPMQVDDGALLLLRRAKLLPPGAALEEVSEADNAVAKKIVEAVHGLPLALDQAGAYIEETERSLSDYVDLYQQYASSLLKRRGASGHDHPAPVTTTFSLSFEKLKALNPTAIELLEFCAFLHPDAIPEEMLIGGASALPPLLRTTVTDPIKFDQTIEDLLKFSFIRRKSDQHILIVQAVVKEAMSEEQQREYMEQVVRVIDTVFPSPGFSKWSQCQRHLLQAQTATKLIQQRNIHLPEAPQLLYRVGEYLYQRGLYEEAEGLLTQASSITEALFGADHPTLIPILNTLGKVYFLQGRYSQVEPLLLRSLTLGERLLGMEDPELGKSLNTLGRTYHKQGRYNEAEPLLQRALALRQKVLGQEHPKVALSMNSLATLFNRQGKYDQAEALYTQALAIRRATLDPQHPDIAGSLNNLAVFYGRRGKYDQAQPLAEQAVKIYEQALGPEHPSVINVLDTLAEIYQEQGKYAEAELLYKRIFSTAHKRLGPKHPELVTYGNNLARLYFLQGQYVEAETTAKQALTLGEKFLGTHHHVGTSINTLADICKAQKKYNEAEELYAQALKIREKVLAPKRYQYGYHHRELC